MHQLPSHLQCHHSATLLKRGARKKTTVIPLWTTCFRLLNPAAISAYAKKRRAEGNRYREKRHRRVLPPAHPLCHRPSLFPSSVASDRAKSVAARNANPFRSIREFSILNRLNRLPSRARETTTRCLLPRHYGSPIRVHTTRYGSESVCLFTSCSSRVVYTTLLARNWQPVPWADRPCCCLHCS